MLYLKKTDKLFKQKNYYQVSEKLWGATATIAPATAFTHKKMTRSHEGVGFYLASVAKERKDESILNIVSIVNSIHQNFYEDNFPPEVIRKASKTIKMFASRMRRKYRI